ncbi:InlB B-repeat-containing protein [Butyrivibrio sp. NC2007]|uniref:InlB B-repeat-containing protein n=1 Tax=Butyrivibrio sp. NC2007 TaxID=1280683 RepID=UPI0003B3287C|nr:InlB B-repeat-containing protein [Butyrivibrio sp. NC2007]
MFIRRLLAAGIAGVLVVATTGADSITVRAGEDDVIIFDLDEPTTEDVEETDEENKSDEPLIIPDSEEDAADDSVEEEELSEDAEEETEEDALSEEELDPELEALVTYDTYYIEFIPGDGKLISSLDFGEDVSSWEYDVSSGIMTITVPGEVKILKSVNYALVVPDGSKEFDGWYFDESYSEKVDFDEGLTLAQEERIKLYAKFNETGYQFDDVPIAMNEPIAEAALPLSEGFASEESFAINDDISEYEPILEKSIDFEDEEVPEAPPEIPQKDYVNLDEAALSGDVPAQTYRESGGTPQSVGGDVISLFKNGSITVSAGGEELQYVDDKDASSISEEGYYFTVVDPAESNSDVNRNIDGDNYVTLVPTDAPEYNLVEGEFKVPITITALELAVTVTNARRYYDGDPVLVYNDNGSVNNEETIKRLGAVVTDSNNEAVSADRYTISAASDSAEIGTVAVIFEGKPERGVKGRRTKNIKITSRPVNKTDVAVSFIDSKLDPNNVPMDGGKATPGVIVKLAANGKELVKDKDYSVTYSNNDAAGKTAGVTLEFAGNYSGTLSNALTFTVAKNVLSKNTVVASAADKRYSFFSRFTSFKSTPVLEYGDKTLKLNTDYEYVDQPKYYYAKDLVEKNSKGQVTYSRKAGQQIPDSETVHRGATIECRFSIVPSSSSQEYTAAKNNSGSYIPISYTVTYSMK